MTSVALTECEVSAKLDMDEDDIEKVFATYRSNGGKFVEHFEGTTKEKML